MPLRLQCAALFAVVSRNFMLKETPLVGLHRESGAKLVDFGGWNMPLHYGSQIEEHHAVRQSSGLFDVSHMTVVDILGAGAKTYLQYLFANDVEKLQRVGKALYTGMLNEAGGVIDDLIVYLTAEGYRLVVNCATREKDLAWMRKHSASFDVEIHERADLAMLAVQGPNARSLVHQLLNDSTLEHLSVFESKIVNMEAFELFVARTGYTGEDGYEIILPNECVGHFARQVLQAGAKFCGLGARDTLRLEAGLNLYGHEMDESVSPWRANMGWTVSMTSPGRDFIGRKALEAEKAAGPCTKLVGLVIQGKGVLRAGQPVVSATEQAKGVITSGSFSPTLSTSIALASVPVTYRGECSVLIREKSVPVKIVKPSFVRLGKKLIE